MKHVQGMFLPIARDDINGGFPNPDGKLTPAPISSNGYYGHHPAPDRATTNDHHHVELMDVQTCEGIQFNNMIETEPEPIVVPRENRRGWGNENRKRVWEDGAADAVMDFKRRRENEKLRSAKKETALSAEGRDHLLDELLLKTHGCNSYHWNGHEL